MKIAVVKESATDETRVALVPETVRKLTDAGWTVVVQRGAGTAAAFPDVAYAEAGAELTDSAADAVRSANVVVGIRAPTAGVIAMIPRGALLIALLDPLRQADMVEKLAQAGITALSLELVPRTTRAQAMDVLSSQATVAGYRAILLAAQASSKLFPMLMTAAGTIPPSKVLVLGAGVAGLQAIATARRLGAVVQGYDIRPAVKEEVESLGATWVGAQLADAGTSGGYAREVTPEEQKKQHEHLAKLVGDADVVVSTAQVPGRRAPVLITDDMVARMKPGSIIVDMAAESGGNCALTKPGQETLVNGVKILGPLNLPAGAPTNASQMFSRNLATLIKTLKTEGGVGVDLTDDILGVCTVAHDGRSRLVDGKIPAPEKPAGAAA